MDHNPIIQQSLQNLGIETLNDLQIAAQSTIAEHDQTVILAPTGSGKTLAFLLPLLLNLDPDKSGIQAVILTPTRELCLQIEGVWREMKTGYKANAVYGGHDIAIETSSLSQPPALLVGTPGRMADHLRRETLDLAHAQMLVLDEFDKSLELGYMDDMAAIVDAVENVQKTVLASATNMVQIPAFTGIREPITLDFTTYRPEGITIRWVKSAKADLTDALVQVLQEIGGESTLIFANFREDVEKASRQLRDAGIHNAFFHGALEQIVRERTLIRFRNGSVHTLVATDLAARGLDIPEVRHVIHLQYPSKEEPYTHRNGRTARMGAEGTIWHIFQSPDRVPVYLNIPEELFEPQLALPNPPKPLWETVYLSGGKKDKVSRGDIVGFFCQKGGLQLEDIGRIEVLDHMTFVAVNRHRTRDLLTKVRNEKMKGKKWKIELAK